KLMMPPFPTYTDDNVRSIIAFVEDASQPAPAAETGAASEAGAADNGDVSNFMFGGLIVVLIIAFLVILVLNRVIRTLDKIILRNQDAILAQEEEEEEGESKGQVFVAKLKEAS